VARYIRLLYFLLKLIIYLLSLTKHGKHKHVADYIVIRLAKTTLMYCKLFKDLFKQHYIREYN